jgi:hypothetical protein
MAIPTWVWVAVAIVAAAVLGTVFWRWANQLAQPQQIPVVADANGIGTFHIPTGPQGPFEVDFRLKCQDQGDPQFAGYVGDRHNVTAVDRKYDRTLDYCGNVKKDTCRRKWEVMGQEKSCTDFNLDATSDTGCKPGRTQTGAPNYWSFTCNCPCGCNDPNADCPPDKPLCHGAIGACR